MTRAKPMSLMQRRHRGGTAYVLVLSVTTLLVTLGFAAIQLAQGQIEQGEIAMDQAKVRLAARTAQDVMHKRNSGSTAWRDGIQSGTWYTLTTQDDVQIFYSYIDPIDGDLLDDPHESVVLYTLAQTAKAYRIYSVEYRVDKDANLMRIASSARQQVFAR